jgi:membrane-bound serine protease (ClpP class)
MFFVIALAITGLLLIFLEFFLPGAIMAIGGALLLMASLGVFHLTFPSGSSLFIYFLALMGAVYFVIQIGIWRVRAAKKTIYLDTDQEGYQACLYPKELIGKIGVSANDLRPSGHIIIDDRSFHAMAKTGFIEKGTPIEVLGGQGAHLIVQQYSEK